MEMLFLSLERQSLQLREVKLSTSILEIALVFAHHTQDPFSSDAHWLLNNISSSCTGLHKLGLFQLVFSAPSAFLGSRLPHSYLPDSYKQSEFS